MNRLSKRQRALLARAGAAFVVVVLVVSLAATAQGPLRGPDAPAAAASAAATAAGPRQVSEYFFGGRVDDYGFPLGLKMRRKLLVLRAHRKMSPCGLVDPVKLVAADPDFQDYGVDGDLSACSLVFQGDDPSVVTVKVSQNPPTMRELEQFSVGPVLVSRHAPAEPGTCLYVFDLGLSELAGAPDRLTDFQAQITAPEEHGDEPCARGEAVASSAAARVAAKGAPQWSQTDPVAKVGLADPCLPARRVPGMVGLSDSGVGTHWCAFEVRPSADAEPVSVKLNVQLRPSQFADQKGDPWNVTESQTTQRGDTMLLVYSGAFDPATNSYRPSSDKLHCDVYLLAKERLLPRSVDASEADDGDARLATVEVRGEQAPCSVNRDVATAWAAQLG